MTGCTILWYLNSGPDRAPIRRHNMKDYDATFEGLLNQFIRAVINEDMSEMVTIMSHAQMASFMGRITYGQFDTIVKLIGSIKK